ncbi:subtilisin-like protein, partial [Zopfia rhizophila CBS 207.26]
IDKSGHGTHVAGIILQFAPDAELYVARVFEHDLTSKLEEEEVINRIVKAIDYATNVWKVNIISMSFGFRQNIDSIYEALRRANLQKVVIFAAASNDGNRLRVAFPARCRDLVICMNSTDGSGGKSVYNP